MATHVSNMLSPFADLIIINGKVVTVDEAFSFAEAVAVKGEKIAAVGHNAEILRYASKDTTVLDLKGKTILPGINDTHIHATLFGGTRPPLALDVGYPAAKSISDIQKLVQEKVRMAQPGEWILGFGWDEGRLEECENVQTRHPARRDLDLVAPDNPVCLTDLQMHIVWANSKALQLAGITKDTLLPSGGVIDRDESTGEPTGLLIELPAMGLVMQKLPAWNRAQKRQAVQTAMRELNAQGITSITEPALGPGGTGYQGGLMDAECISAYNDLYNQDKLTLRVNILLLFGEYGKLSFKDIEQSLPFIGIHSGFGNEWLKIGGVKVFADGVPTAKTAWMYDEYTEGGCGSLVFPGDTDAERYKELMKIIDFANTHCFQLGIHAIGDRAIDACVDGFVKAKQAGFWDARHYIIHGDFISDETINRIAEHGIRVNVSSEVMTVVAEALECLLGKERSTRHYPLRRMVDAGVHITESTDAPCMYPNWKETVQAAVLRKSKATGKVIGPEHQITVKEAIRMFTIESAWLDHMEHIKGSIEVDKLADFCILDEDILEVEPKKIKDIKTLMTIVGGKVVYNII